MLIFRKLFNFGPFRTSVSKSGVGFSWGLPGLRFGVSPNGRKYISVGIPGTGLYMIKYLDTFPNNNNQNSNNNNKKPISNIQKPKYNSKVTEPWWKQKNLMD